MVFVPNKRTRLPVEATPELAARLGVIVAHAAYLEDQMSGLFTDLMETDPAKSSMAFNEIAGRRRRDILVALLQTKQPRDIADTLAALIQTEVRTAFNRRNELVHATFAVQDVKANKLQRMDSFGNNQPVILTPKGLDEDIRYLAKTNAAFEWLRLALQLPSLAIPPEQRDHPTQ